VAAARLGARAAYGGLLGEDDLSAYTLREFEREGVDCSPVLRRPGARPIHSIIIVDAATGQRSILPSFVGVAWRAPGDIPDALVADARVLLIDHHACEANLKAAAIARRLGIPVVADIERDDDPLVAALLPLIDHLIVGARFASKITGRSEPADMAAALASPERACAAVTAGERGCWHAERGGPVRHVPAFAVDVVDTTGCGDVFHGAYAACLARALTVPEAIRVAAAAAALKATQPGGRLGIPTWTAMTQFLANAPARG
jgi:sugar/nucleoside kinase (ribokinase family)